MAELTPLSFVTPHCRRKQNTRLASAGSMWTGQDRERSPRLLTFLRRIQPSITTRKLKEDNFMGFKYHGLKKKNIKQWGFISRIGELL